MDYLKLTVPERRFDSRERSEQCLSEHFNKSTLPRILHIHREEKVYQWKVMIFGLSIALRTFTMLLRPIASPLKSLGVKLLINFDDMLIVALKQEILSNNLSSFLALPPISQHLGVIKNLSSSYFILHYCI